MAVPTVMVFPMPPRIPSRNETPDVAGPMVGANCRCILVWDKPSGAKVRLRAWGRNVAEFAGGGEDTVLPRFRLAGGAPYFLLIHYNEGKNPNTDYRGLDVSLPPRLHLSGLIYTAGLGLTKAVPTLDLIIPKLDGYVCPASSPSRKLPRVLIHHA